MVGVAWVIAHRASTHGVDLRAHGVLAALPGARIAPGLVRFQLAAVTCEGLQRKGLEWLAGAAALSEIGIDGLPPDWPVHAAVYGCSSIDQRHWLLLLPERAQLWLGSRG